MSKLPPVTLTRLSAVAAPRETGAIETTIARIEASAGGDKPTVDAVLRSIGIRAPAETVTSLQANAVKRPLTVAEVDAMLSNPATTKYLSKPSSVDRIAAKSALRRAGLLN